MGLDTERTSVKTYIPRYQREVWEQHAEELNMSRSEFIRTMVQAGRRSFDATEEILPPTEITDSSHVDGQDTDTAAADLAVADDLDAEVLDVLDREGPLSWDDLLAVLTGNIEQRLDTALERLQRENRVQYSGRHGGYTRLEDDGD